MIQSRCRAGILGNGAVVLLAGAFASAALRSRAADWARHRRPHPVRVLHQRCARAEQRAHVAQAQRRSRVKTNPAADAATRRVLPRTDALPPGAGHERRSRSPRPRMPSTIAAMKSTRPSMRCPRCRLGLDETDENRIQRAEAYALGTACTLAGREMSSIPFAGGRIGSRIDEAVQARAEESARAAGGSAGAVRARRQGCRREGRRAQEAARGHRHVRSRRAPRASTTPEWGAAEAYAFLGRALFDQRDVVGAREALERSLLIAPEYAFARKPRWRRSPARRSC